MWCAHDCMTVTKASNTQINMCVDGNIKEHVKWCDCHHMAISSDVTTTLWHMWDETRLWAVS